MPQDRSIELGKQTLTQLRLTPLFSGLAEADLADLLGDADIIRAGDGEVLFRQDHPADCFYCLLDGRVEILVEAGEGRHSVIEVMEKGALIGEATIFGEGRRQTTARVLAGARLLRVPAPPFIQRLERRFDVILAMLSSMSFGLRMLIRQIAELKLKTTAQRLGGFLLSLTETPSGQAAVRFPYDKRIVADKLGMKPESLSRALARLAAVGVRSQADNTVIITDVAKLRRFSIEEGLD